MVKVEYACDMCGDHTAHASKLIDSDTKEFATIYEALAFATECVECLNYKELHKKAGLSEEAISSLHSEDLLLNSDEFDRYREHLSLEEEGDDIY